MKKKCKKCDTVYDMNDVACPSCGKKGYDVIDESISSTEARTIGVIVGFVLIVLVLVVYSSSNNKTDIEYNQYSDCYTHSNTYYKCSWSALEDGCVCKQR